MSNDTQNAIGITVTALLSGSFVVLLITLIYWLIPA